MSTHNTSPTVPSGRLEKGDVDVIVNTLEQELALESENILPAGSFEGSDNSLENVSAPLVVDKLDELDTARRDDITGMRNNEVRWLK